MMNTRKTLAYLAAAAALSLASCSDAPSQTASRPAAQHRFNVYFDVAKSDLTPEGQQVIAEAAAAANRNASTKIVVVAPETDSKGRRADAVNAALIAAGVSPDRIDARWIGPQDVAPSGVRDPRHRVVEISLESDGSTGGAKVLVSKQANQ